MEWVKKKIRFLKRRNEKLKLSPWYIENGGKLLEGLIASSNGKYNIPYRVFTVEELNKATNVDFPSLSYSDSRHVMCDLTGYYISGSFQQRSILVKKFSFLNGEGRSYHVVNDIVVTVLMNHHKNVLKVLGCCLDLEIPAIIYEIGINYGLLHDLLFRKKEGNNIGRSLSWSNRLKIARDVANALVYLHTEFPTPIIHTDLTTENIVIDNKGVAKLVDFSLCVALPPGESQVEKAIVGTVGHIEPDYMTTGIITEKSDVYLFGIILLQLLASNIMDDINADRKDTYVRSEFFYLGSITSMVNPRHNEHFGETVLALPRYLYKYTPLVEYVHNHVDKNELSKILDPIILEEGDEIEHQLQAFSRLALRCTVKRGADRPYIFDVAKELVRIQRSVHPI